MVFAYPLIVRLFHLHPIITPMNFTVFLVITQVGAGAIVNLSPRIDQWGQAMMGSALAVFAIVIAIVQILNALR